MARGAFVKASWDTPYDVAPDGRVLVMKTETHAPPNQIVVVSNWLEDVARAASAK